MESINWFGYSGHEKTGHIWLFIGRPEPRWRSNPKVVDQKSLSFWWNLMPESLKEIGSEFERKSYSNIKWCAFANIFFKNRRSIICTQLLLAVHIRIEFQSVVTYADFVDFFSFIRSWFNFKFEAVFNEVFNAEQNCFKLGSKLDYIGLYFEKKNAVFSLLIPNNVFLID